MRLLGGSLLILYSVFLFTVGVHGLMGDRVGLPRDGIAFASIVSCGLSLLVAAVATIVMPGLRARVLGAIVLCVWCAVVLFRILA